MLFSEGRIFLNLAGFPDYEAENWVLMVSSESRTGIGEDPVASNGTHVYYKGNVLGDWIELDLGDVPAGRYEVQVGGKTHTDRATYQLSLAGENVGGPVDQYAEASVFTPVSVGEWTWTGGQATARFTLVDNHADAPSYLISLDILKLIRLGDEPGSWAGYPIIKRNETYLFVDTDSFLGQLWVWGDLAFSAEFDNWIYCPERSITEIGSWVFVFR